MNIVPAISYYVMTGQSLREYYKTFSAYPSGLCDIRTPGSAQHTKNAHWRFEAAYPWYLFYKNLTNTANEALLS
jgi:hypothetical protein